jgi:hypothetical protein
MTIEYKNGQYVVTVRGVPIAFIGIDRQLTISQACKYIGSTLAPDSINITNEIIDKNVNCVL